MEREELRAILQKLLEEEMGESYPAPADDLELREGLNLDSVDVVGLLMRIEREYRVRLKSSELEPIKTVGQLLDLLNSKLLFPKSDGCPSDVPLR